MTTAAPSIDVASIQRRLLATAPPTHDPERITTPTTVVHGRDDLQVPVSVVARAHRRHGWPLHAIVDCRDDPATEQPAAFLAALRGALTDDPTSTEGARR